MLYFVADTHLGHGNIIKYCARPFSSTHEHDQALISNWNSVVKENDTVYHLGDFGLAHPKYLLDLSSMLNGKIILIKGNHDKAIKGQLAKRFSEIHVGYHELKKQDPEMDMNQLIVLCHYPLLTWNKRYFGSWHLHGHVHGNIPGTDDTARLDVGVDTNNYTPVSYDQVKEIMTRKVIKPLKKNFEFR